MLSAGRGTSMATQPDLPSEPVKRSACSRPAEELPWRRNPIFPASRSSVLHALGRQRNFHGDATRSSQRAGQAFCMLSAGRGTSMATQPDLPSEPVKRSACSRPAEELPWRRNPIFPASRSSVLHALGRQRNFHGDATRSSQRAGQAFCMLSAGRGTSEGFQERGRSRPRRCAETCRLPLRFAALTGRSGHRRVRSRTCAGSIRPVFEAGQSSRGSERTRRRSAASCSGRTRPNSCIVRCTRPITPGCSV